MFDVIIVTHNARDKLSRCLASIKTHTRNCLVTVFDNCSGDGTRPYLKSLKGINYIFSDRNLGFCGGVNLALRKTRSRFIALLDDDAEVTDGWLDGLYGQMKRRPSVGIVGCKIVFFDNRIMAADYRVKPLYLAGAGETDRGQRDYIKECEGLVGTCWLMRRAVIRKVGYFDERFFPSQHEDVDYCLRARLAGYKILYNGKVKVIHHHLFRDGGQRHNAANWRRFLKKWSAGLDKFPLKDSHPVDRCMAKGEYYLKIKKPERAFREFRKLTQYGRGFREPFCEGVSLLHMGEYNEAIRGFEEVLRLNPLDTAAHYYLGLAFNKIGRHKEAKRLSAKAVPHLFSRKNKHITN